MEAFNATKNHHYTVYSGAVGAGKTLFAAHVAIEACVNNPGSKGFLGCLTYTQLKNVFFTTFKEEAQKYEDLLRENNIPVKLLKRLVTSKGNMEAEFFNGSIIYFVACEKEEKLRGYTLDFFILDEPIEIDEKIFKQLMARMRGKHMPRTFGLLTTNPGSQNHWIYRRFYGNIENKNEYKHIDTCTYDNVFLDPSYIKDMESAYDEDWIKRFLRGKWGAFSGQIYKRFSPEKHVGSFKENTDIKYYIAGVDFGVKNPSCVITLGVTKEGDVYVVDEYYKAERTSQQVAKIIEAFHNKYHYRKVYCDPSAKDLIMQTKSLGVPIEKADNEVAGGISKVQSLLKKDLFAIDKSCFNLIREMQDYRYKKDKLNQNEVEEPVKLDDHSVDALRYALTNFRLFKYKNLIGWTKMALWDFPKSD